jgi:hypothetical protein
MFTVLTLGAAHANDTYHFKDVLKPHGHERTLSAKFADGRSCGVVGIQYTGNVGKFLRCMRVHGRVVDRFTPDPSPRVTFTAPPTPTVRSNTDDDWEKRFDEDRRRDDFQRNLDTLIQQLNQPQ